MRFVCAWALQTLLCCCLLLLLVPVHGGGSSSHSSSRAYTAAAVQFTTRGNYTLPAWRTVQLNIDAYEAWVEKAAKAGADIVIFPEGGLGMFNAEGINTRDAMLPYCVDLGAVGEDNNPCEAFSAAPPAPTSPDYQRWRASCYARDHSLTVAIDTCETRPCTGNETAICPRDGRWQWNTQVVWGPRGDLQLKYHKSHLFGESAVFDQAAAEVVTFTAAFGATFGTFICFDMMYARPAGDVVASGVRDVLFSSWWVNATPTFNAVMIQQAWSRIHRANLIAANTGASFNNAGGGIFAEGEPLDTLWDSKARGVDHMLLAQLSPPQAQEAGREQKQHAVELMSKRRRKRQPSATDEPSLPVVHLSAMETVECLPNRVTPSATLANCTLFTAADLRARAVAAGHSPLSTRFTLPVVTAGSVACTASLTLGSTVDASEQFGLIAYEGVQTFAFTPDPLSLQVCSLQHCATSSKSNVAVCSSSFAPYRTTMSAWQLTLQGVDPAATVFPMLSVDDGQVGSKSLAAFDDRLTATGQRTATWTSTATFKEQSLYSTVLYAVRPHGGEAQEGIDQRGAPAPFALRHALSAA